MRQTICYFETPVRLGTEEAVYFGAALCSGAFPFRTKDKRWGLADPSKNVLRPAVYDMLAPMPKLEDLYLLACRDAHWGLLDANGCEVLSCQWDQILFIMENLLAVRSGNLWGFVHWQQDRFILGAPAIYGDWKASLTADGIGIILVRQDFSWGTMGENGSGMLLSRWGVLDGQCQLLAKPQWCKEPQLQGGTDQWEHVYNLTSACVDTPQGLIHLVKDERLTLPLREGAYL